MNKDLNKLATALTAQHKWVKFKFDARVGSKNWAWRYLTSCILVGGSQEVNTLEVAKDIFAQYPTPEHLAVADKKSVARIIQLGGVRFHGPKADYIIGTAKQLVARYGSVVPNDRAALETFPGVGRHVASVILATVYGQNEFAVDVHVRRIAERFGVTGNDLQIENAIRKAVRPELLGHFSRSFVDFGQTQCAANPSCSGCKMKKFGCGTETKVAVPKAPAKPGLKDFENYEINKTVEGLILRYAFKKTGSTSQCFVKCDGAKLTCTCNGFRFQKKCKHIEMAKDL